ncbi:nucleoside hydrolase [Bifidobacterium simiarum]|uniref:nucleoside hydrolase n=1 Tax=Bifidobacterium simiarum TaxID=2045441 RepID=UPI001BDC683D|nr:nucleoside hydrolase [Bifidobacterium simiarum]MBT1166257.1 nucleoside hydrolase [Bifidobacterium simiarum]
MPTASVHDVPGTRITPGARRKLIIDTDCGSDDAMAIAMALNDPRYEILMFSTVSGNVHVDQAITNTLTTIEHAGTYEPPVYVGCESMLLRPLVYAHETHGDDGMGDLGLRPSRLRPAPGNGVLRMLEELRSHEPGEIDVVALGPLTNLAVAIRLDPQAMARIDRLTVMGSAGLGRGNVTPVAEFNVWQDAEAARIVLEFGFEHLTFVGWDACLGESMLDPDDIRRLRESGPLGRFAIDCNRVLMAMNVERFGDEYLDMADPAAMAAALHPECIAECDRYHCQIDVSDGPSYGSMLVDVNRFDGQPANAAVCSRLHADRYKRYLFATLGAGEWRRDA